MQQLVGPHDYYGFRDLSCQELYKADGEADEPTHSVGLIFDYEYHISGRVDHLIPAAHVVIVRQEQIDDQVVDYQYDDY
jgi:hypothetical protein